MVTVQKLREAAGKFLARAETNRQGLNEYLDGSRSGRNTKAYREVRFAENAFIDKLNKFEVEHKIGRWSYGLDYDFNSSGGGGWAATFVDSESDGYPTEKEAIYAALLEIEKKIMNVLRSMPGEYYDDNGDIISNSAKVSNLKSILKRVLEYKEMYDHIQLELF